MHCGNDQGVRYYDQWGWRTRSVGAKLCRRAAVALHRDGAQSVAGDDDSNLCSPVQGAYFLLVDYGSSSLILAVPHAPSSWRPPQRRLPTRHDAGRKNLGRLRYPLLTPKSPGIL